MGLFKSLKDIKNVVSASNGVGDDAIVGRAIVIDASLAGMAITVGVEEYRVCNLRLQIFLDGRTAYIAECRQKIQVWRLGQLVGQAVAVRVDAQDPTKVAIDFSADSSSTGRSTLLSTFTNSPVPESSIFAGTDSPAATFQTRSSRTAIMLRSFSNSAGKLTTPNGSFRPP